MSHPSWVCGLKLTFLDKMCVHFAVTPFVGVWIETFRVAHSEKWVESHPSWVCGLKHPIDC